MFNLSGGAGSMPGSIGMGQTPVQDLTLLQIIEELHAAIAKIENQIEPIEFKVAKELQPPQGRAVNNLLFAKERISAAVSRINEISSKIAIIG